MVGPGDVSHWEGEDNGEGKTGGEMETLISFPQLDSQTNQNPCKSLNRGDQQKGVLSDLQIRKIALDAGGANWRGKRWRHGSY